MGEFIRPKITDKEKGIYGHVDFINADGIGGWVIDVQSAEPRVVEIYLNEEKIGEVVASLPRADISSILGRDVNCGFFVRWSELSLPSKLNLEDDFEIVVIEKQSGREIIGKHVKRKKTKDVIRHGIFFNIDSLRIRGGRIYGWGWLFHKKICIKDLRLLCYFNENFFYVPTKYGLIRKDVYKDYNFSNALKSGFLFSGKLPISEIPDKFYIEIAFDNGVLYRMQVFPQICIKDNDIPMFDINHFLDAIKETTSNNNFVLIIDHKLGGGANLYRNRLIEELKDLNPILLLMYDLPKLRFELVYIYREKEIAFQIEDIYILSELFNMVKFREIILNNLVSFDNPLLIIKWLIDIKNRFRVKITIPIHDYFCICPSYTLIDYKGDFCGIPEIEICRECLRNHKSKELEMLTDFRNIDEYRAEWGMLIQMSDNIICFSNSSVELLKKAYPEIKDSKITIKPHTVEAFRKINVDLSSPLCIGIVGHISSEAKGSRIVKEMVKFIEENDLPIRVVIIGDMDDPPHSHILKITGSYKREELPDIIEKSGANIFFVPSICPETFSFVTSELIQMGVPVVTFNIGAQAEKIKDYHLGLVIPKMDIKNIVQSIYDFYTRLKQSYTISPKNLNFLVAGKNSSIKVFTSATISYLPKVRVMCKTLKKYHPEFEIYFVLVDKVPDWLDLKEEPYDNVIPIEEITEISLKSWIFKYSIVEMCTAVKPFALKKLLAMPDCEMVFYFDPDIAFFSRIDELVQELKGANIILTPHQTKPESIHDAIWDNEICSLKHGIFNLGFIGVRKTEEGIKFANWWADRVDRFCWAELDQGLWTDQKWIDFVPVFFEGVKIIKNSRFNVAPWNLTTRKLSGSIKDGFTVDGQPLGFFHFTGFDSGAHEVMAMKYAGNNNAVKELISWYKDQLKKNDIKFNKEWAYASYKFFENGEPITEIHRLIYKRRRDLQEAFPDPFKYVKDGHCYFNWFKWRAHIEHPELVALLQGYKHEKI